jgi:hypothetical protein
VRGWKWVYLAIALATCTARADGTCEGFTWNVTVERALFDGAPRTARAASIVARAPVLELRAAYALELASQKDVAFAVAPGRRQVPEGVHAGLAIVKFPHAGRYRVSLDAPAWIDVVVDGKAVSSGAIQGRAGCNAPHKIVEFDVPAGDALLQVSAAAADHVRIAITDTAR